MEKGAVGRVVVLMVVVVVVVGMGGRGVSAQDTSGCIKDLVVCQPAIFNTSTKPDTNCCSSLKNAVSKDLACLCNIYKTDTIFQSLKLNKTRAMELPALCSINANLSLCASATPPSSSTNASAESSPSTPQAGSGSGSSSGAMKLGWGVKPWWALVFLSASLIGL